MSYIINILNNGQYVGIPALRGLQGPQGPAMGSMDILDLTMDCK